MHGAEGMKRAGSARPRGPQASTLEREPCQACGEETAAGSIFFADRRAIHEPGVATVYLCVLCDARIRAARRGRQLTDDDVRILVRTGSLLDLAWKRF
jgi:hypothetical protein